jgi:CobQ-like glutamine amidotransferase family enzyme
MAIQTIPILILGRHNNMMQNVITFLLNNGFSNIKGVLTNDEVKTCLLTNQYDIVIIGGGVDNETRLMIKQLINDNHVTTKIVEYFGNPVILIDEINSSLNN